MHAQLTTPFASVSVINQLYVRARARQNAWCLLICAEASLPRALANHLHIYPRRCKTPVIIIRAPPSPPPAPVNEPEVVAAAAVFAAAAAKYSGGPAVGRGRLGGRCLTRVMNGVHSCS